MEFNVQINYLPDEYHSISVNSCIYPEYIYFVADKLPFSRYSTMPELLIHPMIKMIDVCIKTKIYRDDITFSYFLCPNVHTQATKQKLLKSSTITNAILCDVKSAVFGEALFGIIT